MDDDDQIIVNDEHIIVQEDIIVQGEIMDPEIETFVEELMQETDVICCLCNGTGRDDFGDDCTLCDGIGKLLECDDESHQHAGQSDAVDATSDKKPERRVVTDGEWQKIRITLDSGSTMLDDELCPALAKRWSKGSLLENHENRKWHPNPICQKSLALGPSKNNPQERFWKNLKNQ